jgi:hypothetical protein
MPALLLQRGLQAAAKPVLDAPAADRLPPNWDDRPQSG